MADGYWSAHVDSPGQDIARGPLYRLRNIEARDEQGLRIEGFSVREWRGEPASRRNVEAVQGALRAHLLHGGFPFAETVTQLHADTLPPGNGDGAKPGVDMILAARRGAAFKLGEPLVRGTRTSPRVARHLALWEEGENFSPDRLQKGVRRLRRTGYFESAEWTGLYRDSTRNVLYPLLQLPDAQANTIGGLLGFDSEAEDGGELTGYLDIRLVNILGTARDFAFSFDSRASGEREAHVSYTEPWIFTLPVGARVEGSFQQQDTAFWEWNQDLIVFRDLDFSSRVEAEFGAQANRTAGNETDAEIRTRALRSGVRLLYDNRDRVPFTRAGTRASAGLTAVRREFTDSAYYLTQGRVEAERWMSLTERFGLKLGARAASNFPLNRLNRGELWDLGGARSLRGYRERAFQTNAYLLGDAELHFSVGRRGRLFGFTSPGFINRPSGRLDPRRVLGYGAGMELAQGDWSVAVTYALNPERSVGNGFLHVAVENRF